MTQDELAKAAGVGLSTVKDFESGKREPIQATQTAMRVVLEREGFAFAFSLDDDGMKKAYGITYSAPEKGTEH